jgi:hypothetical protein
LTFNQYESKEVRTEAAPPTRAPQHQRHGFPQRASLRTRPLPLLLLPAAVVAVVAEGLLGSLSLPRHHRGVGGGHFPAVASQQQWMLCLFIESKTYLKRIVSSLQQPSLNSVKVPSFTLEKRV